MTRLAKIIATLGAVALCLAALEAAHADWLVTSEGERIETRGEWKVEGSRVVFRLPNGNLSALRLSAVDLDASRAATEAATAPAQPAPRARSASRPPVLVLTDADVARVSPEELARVRAAAEADDAQEGGSEADDLADSVAEGAAQSDADPAAAGSADAPAATSESAASTGEVVVSSWSDTGDAASGVGVRFEGSLRNERDLFAALGGVQIVLLDEAGSEIARQIATTEVDSLAPGASTGFSADFVGVFNYTDVKMKVLRSFLQQSEPPDPEATTDTPPPVSVSGGAPPSSSL